MSWNRLAAVFIAAIVAIAGRDASAQFQIASSDGKSSLNLGFLSQLQYEGIDNADASHVGQNLFFRRLRVMAGGKVNEKLSFFFETDSPNLGKLDAATGKKIDSTIFIQDFYLTYTATEALKLDAGMLMVPVSHNSQQSATSLATLDYGTYTFLHSDPINSKTGRDFGLQARGYVAHDHLEYRLGVFQGNRGTDARGAMRVAGRLVLNVFDADKGFFYTGTTLGKKHILSFGASYDRQDAYEAYSGDLVLDQPIGRDVLTLQGDYTRFDGGTFLKSLPQQDVMLGEASYYIGAVFGPFVQYNKREYKVAGFHDESRVMGGIAWWGNGHKCNLKLAYGKIKKDGVTDRDQFNVQWQVLAY